MRQGRVGVGVEVGEVVGGLVAVDVLADQAGDVFDVGVLVGVDLASNMASSLASEGLGAAEEWMRPAQSWGWYQEYCQELPSVKPLPAPALAGSKGVRKAPEARRGSTKPSAGVEVVAPVGGALEEGGGDVGVAEGGGGAGDRPVVEGVLHGFGGGFVVVVDGDVAEAHVVGEVAVGGVGGAGDHGAEGFFAVEAGDVFEEGVGDLGDGVVADHAPGFEALLLPDGEDAEGAFVPGG